MSKDLSIKIRSEIYKQNLNQKRLAEEMGISQAYLSDILRGKRDGDKAKEHIKHLCATLGIASEVN